MTVEELRALQDREDLRERHLIYLGESGFVIAHTDHERALAGAGGVPLDECPVHRWAQRSLVPIGAGGIYRVIRRLGSEQEPYALERARVAV